VDHHESEAFGDALVALSAGDLRIRIVCDRGQVFADFGSVAQPDKWFDSAIVMEAMELSTNGGFRAPEIGPSLQGLAALLQAVGHELVQMFRAQEFPKTERKLAAIQEARAAKRFGG
jgi:hypothetical protein